MSRVEQWNCLLLKSIKLQLACYQYSMIKSEENTHPVAYLFVEEKEILQKTSASLSLPLDPGRKPILFSTPEVDSRLFKLLKESFLWAVGTVSILLRL